MDTYLRKQYLALAKTSQLVDQKHGCFMEDQVTFEAQAFPLAMHHKHFACGGYNC